MTSLPPPIDPPELEDPGVRAVARCQVLAGSRFNEPGEGTCRRYLTPEHRRALDQLGEWMRAAGMTVRIDAVGNLIGRYEGLHERSPALLIGSHLDTVPAGGRYDGALGILVGVECVARLAARGCRLPYALEVIAFGDEEGSRFPRSMFCSNALAGQIDGRALETADAAGRTLAEALGDFGLDPRRVREAARAAGDLLGFVEPHIEQGPVLEAEDLPVGVVTGIASQLRFTARFQGQAGHAGTTPMRLRKDALAAAAAGVLAVEDVCRGGGGGLVGTVGRLRTSTGAFNVIAGSAEIAVDLRAPTRALRDAAFGELERRLLGIAAERGLRVVLERIQDLPECLCDPGWTTLLAEAVSAAGVRPYALMSGAGHDAMAVAGVTPVAMLFIRCAGGISHHVAESVEPRDVSVAVRTLLNFLERLPALAASGVAA